MENYKILEDRPELSPKELTEGMDFSKLKANVAAATKMVVIKSIIIKTIFGAAIITSGIFVYHNTKVSFPKQEPQLLAALTDKSKTDSTVEVKPISIMSKEIVRQIVKDSITINKLEKENAPVQVLKIQALADTLKTAKAIVPVIALPKNCSGTEIQNHDSLSREKDTETTSTKRENLVKSTAINHCKIWRTNNFCNTSNAPDYKYTMECDDCDFDYINCEKVKPNETVCVLITLTGNGKQNLKIESKLKNISLTDATGRNTQTPMLIGIGNDGKFLGTNFKAKKFLINYTKQINIYVFFKSAKIGDKIIIKDLIEAVIEQ